MSFFVSPTPAPAVQSSSVSKIALLYAAILVVMVVAQLFTFETFVELFSSLGLPGSASGGYVLAAVLIVTEILALPFLLRMALSPAFRWLSIASGLTAALIWVFVTVWVQSTDVSIDTIGFLGTAVPLAPGAWAVSISVALFILSVWAIWGMWPLQAKKPSSRKK